MNKAFYCLVSKDHPLLESLQQSSAKINVTVLDGDQFPETLPLAEGDFILDLCLLKTKEKRKLLHCLTSLQFQIISDLSINWMEGLHQEFPSLCASFSLAFYSPLKTYECYIKTPEAYTYLQKFLEEIHLKTSRVDTPQIGSHFPRTLAMIINEAFFCLEENLASREDIDKAIKYGMNHPLGPFEWGKKTGYKTVLNLLDELHDVFKDPRYRASSRLRVEAAEESPLIK